MKEASLWKRQRRRAKHRKRRPRRAALGEMELWDSSTHGLLEDRAGGDQVLISMHDHATSRLMTARFVARDEGAENRRTMIAYLRRHGRPLAVYTDHAGHFGQWLTKKEERTDTIISRPLGELGVKVILAGSPQAKGRVERTFGTAQDRLIKEMRVAGIDALDGANRFLTEWWTPFWNERFTVASRDPVDAHRPLPSGIDLEALFAETETRKVARDFTIRFRNRYWQIPEREATDFDPGAEVHGRAPAGWSAALPHRIPLSGRRAAGSRSVSRRPFAARRPEAGEAAPEAAETGTGPPLAQALPCQRPRGPGPQGTTP